MVARIETILMVGSEFHRYFIPRHKIGINSAINSAIAATRAAAVPFNYA